MIYVFIFLFEIFLRFKILTEILVFEFRYHQHLSNSAWLYWVMWFRKNGMFSSELINELHVSVCPSVPAMNIVSIIG